MNPSLSLTVLPCGTVDVRLAARVLPDRDVTEELSLLLHGLFSGKFSELVLSAMDRQCPLVARDVRKLMKKLDGWDDRPAVDPLDVFGGK